MLFLRFTIISWYIWLELTLNVVDTSKVNSDVEETATEKRKKRRVRRSMTTSITSETFNEIRRNSVSFAKNVGANLNNLRYINQEKLKLVLS